MQRILILFFCLACFLGACANIPELDGKISDSARKLGYPDLIQLDGVEASANEGFDTTQATAKSMKQRLKDLRKRARALRKPVVDRSTRRRMETALNQDRP